MVYGLVLGFMNMILGLKFKFFFLKTFILNIFGFFFQTYNGWKLNKTKKNLKMKRTKPAHKPVYQTGSRPRNPN